ncbi:hypothetical protein SPRG_05949 [Saprolegnia parasitica CBS 223.65]|uniref:Uncharacterized protein n=1 Tax=Saprolegnia parasitica (strain CBS 223.65) TaxID=695850 RepID=A0A067CRH4_SAPPC|nr:hypothetical protein SPRG_05949 [Saprolegnia parasitica CBS 223.65]KDO29412.1 hypothetical protein SPRG_05949 [Saprolegnia parasitica CBS 223.65]|eukprot:XP_012199914.1 hypothetical protein SPRG_05949 [Saprolegnia parasitica CBS 223.65]
MTELYTEARSRTCVQPIQVVGVSHDSPLSWSPSGRRLAFVAGNNSIFVCASTGTADGVVLEKIVPLFKKEVHVVMFFADREDLLLVAGAEGLAFVNVETGDVAHRIGLGEENNHESDITCATWLYDGLILATGSKDTTIKLWARDHTVPTEWLCLETLAAHKAPLLTMTFSAHTHALFTSGRDSSIKNWDVRSLHPNAIQKRKDDGSISCSVSSSMEGHQGDVVTLTVTENGKLLFSGARDNTIKVWNVAQHREIRIIKGHTGDIRRIILLNDEQHMYSASADGTIRLLKLLDVVQDDETILSAEDLERDREAADKLALEEILGASKSDMAYAAGMINPLAMPRDELLMTLNAHDEHVFRMEVNPCVPLLATAGNHEVRIWSIDNIAKPVLLNEFVAHTGTVTSVSLLHEDKHLVSSSLDGRIHLYNVGSIHREAKLDVYGSRLLFCSGNDYDIRGFVVQDANIGAQCVVELTGHAGKVYCMASSPDGTVLFVRLETRGAQPELPGRECPTSRSSTRSTPRSRRCRLQRSSTRRTNFAAAFNAPSSNEGVRLATCGNDHAIKLWRLRGHALSEGVLIPDAHLSVISCLTWGKHASSHLLFSGGWDHTIKVWDLTVDTRAPSAPIGTLHGHKGRLSSLQVTDDGQLLVSTAADGTTKLWQAVAPFQLLCTYVGAVEGGASSLAVGRNIIATGYDDGMIRVWPLMRSDGSVDAEYDGLFLTPDELQVLTTRSHVSGSTRKKGAFSPTSAPSLL